MNEQTRKGKQYQNVNPAHAIPRVVNPQFTLDTDTQQFFTIIHRGVNGFVLVQNLSAGKDGKQRQSYWACTGKPITLPRQVIETGNIFFGINPAIEIVTAADRAKYPDKTDAQIAPMVGTKNHTIAALNALHREYDAKDFTEPAQAEIDAHYRDLRADPANAKNTDAALRNQAIGNAKDAEFQRDPAKYLALVKAHVDNLTPAPSVVVFSGGGYQCYWLLAEPLIIRTHIDDHAAHVQSYAANLQKRWVQLDPKADQGVNDIRRIYRLPGSRNHKKKYAPNFPLVSFYRKRFDLRYSLQGLKALLPSLVAPQVTRTTHSATTATTATTSTPYEGDSPIVAYNAAHTITALLDANGYTAHGDRYMRPGGSDSPGVEIDTNTNRSRHWSSNDPLYDPHWRSPFDVFCTFANHGNVRVAVAAAAVELGMVRPPINVTDTLDFLRLWIKTRNLSSSLPAGPGSKKVRLVVDAIFDLMEANQRFTVTAGKKRLAGLAGVSANTVKNVLALVNEHIFDVTPTEYGDRITLVSNCRLQFFDPLLDVVVKGLTTRGQKTANDKNAYSPHKADDAFATGTSRYMRDHIKDLAQALDLTYPQTAKEYTHRGLGEGVLLAFDTWLRLGDFTAQEYAEETGLKLSTVRGPLRYAETMGLAETEREGQRGPKTYSFVPDFWEKISELLPKMRTYNMSSRREDKRLEAAQQWAKKELDEAKQAQDIEETQRLDKRCAHLAKQRLPHLERLYPSMTPKERERLAYEVAAYKRSAQTDQAIRTERTAQRTEHRDDVTMIRELAESFSDIDTPLEDVFNQIMKFGVFDQRMVRDVLQSPVQMANFETVEDLRKRMRQEDLAIPHMAIDTPPSYGHNQMALAGAA